MGRKDLDLSLLQQEVNDRQAGKRELRQTHRQAEFQVKAMNSFLEGADEFHVHEEDNETVIIHNAFELPSDDEIERMKHALAERDRMKREQWLSNLSLWNKVLFYFGVVKYE